MTDKELLELASKAAGYNIKWRDMKGGYERALITPKLNEKWWNPIADDGDALRLAVKLNMLIDPNNGHVTTCTATGGFAEAEECTSECKYAATRRAIVRAAAAIGEKL